MKARKLGRSSQQDKGSVRSSSSNMVRGGGGEGHGCSGPRTPAVGECFPEADSLRNSLPSKSIRGTVSVTSELIHSHLKTIKMGPKTNKHAQEAKEREAAKKESQQVIAPARTHFIRLFFTVSFANALVFACRRQPRRLLKMRSGQTRTPR